MIAQDVVQDAFMDTGLSLVRLNFLINNRYCATYVGDQIKRVAVNKSKLFIYKFLER